MSEGQATPSSEKGPTDLELGEFLLQQSPTILSDKHIRIDEFLSIFTAIKLATKVIKSGISGANTFGLMNHASSAPVESMEQMAQRCILDAIINRRVVAGISLHSVDNFIRVEGGEKKSLVILVHAMDGTRQIDVNVSVGTIFSIYKRVTAPGTSVQECDFLQPGNQLLCAGYVIYGSSTMLVYSMGDGVDGFTLNPSVGTFYLSHPRICMPQNGNIYSVNGGKRNRFPAGVNQYIEECQEKGIACRYIGSMVADFHRNLLKGGIYIYPPTFIDPVPSVSMIYQCIPLAFIAEQCGGKASDGFTNISDIKPKTFTDRIPFFCGSKAMVEAAEKCMARNKMIDGGWSFSTESRKNTCIDNSIQNGDF